MSFDDSHFSAQQLEAWTQKTLSSNELLKLDEHLANCPVCREKVRTSRPLPETATWLRNVVIGEHLTDDEIDGYVDDRLFGEPREIANQHLKECCDCKGRIDSLLIFKAEMRKLPPRRYEPAPRLEWLPQLEREEKNDVVVTKNKEEPWKNPSPSKFRALVAQMRATPPPPTVPHTHTENPAVVEERSRRPSSPPVPTNWREKLAEFWNSLFQPVGILGAAGAFAVLFAAFLFVVSPSASRHTTNVAANSDIPTAVQPPAPAPSSPSPVPGPKPDDYSRAAFVSPVILDGGYRISLSPDGSVAGLEDLPASLVQRVKDVLNKRDLAIPQSPTDLKYARQNNLDQDTQDAHGSHLALGIIYAQVNRLDLATKEFDALSEQNPDSDLIRQLKAELK